MSLKVYALEKIAFLQKHAIMTYSLFHVDSLNNPKKSKFCVHIVCSRLESPGSPHCVYIKRLIFTLIFASRF